MKSLFVFLFLFISLLSSYSQSGKQIKVHFKYGSKPKKEFKQTEKKWFGGIHGGHVSIEIDNEVIGFEPKTSFHIFPKKKNRNSYFNSEPVESWRKNISQLQYLSITIPIADSQYVFLKESLKTYQKNVPYDYAFFGYRCAASTYEILASLKLVKDYGNYRTVKKYFYPRKLRTKLIKEAYLKNYLVHYHKGRNTRRYEKDLKMIKRIIGRLTQDKYVNF